MSRVWGLLRREKTHFPKCQRCDIRGRKDVKWQNVLDKEGGEFVEIRLISRNDITAFLTKVHTLHFAFFLTFSLFFPVFLWIAANRRGGYLDSLRPDVRRLFALVVHKWSQMSTWTVFIYSSDVISCLDRKRTSPSAKDEHSAGVKDHLLAHSSDPVEMRRLNYQTQGTVSQY